MIRKYIKRILTWGLLVTLLTMASIYGRGFILNPIDNQITELEKDQTTLNNNILLLKTQINRFTALNFDNEQLKHYIPTGYNQLELEQKYIQKPARVEHVNGVLNNNYRITRNQKPAELSLSNSIQGVRINATIEFETENQIYTYLSELQNTIRAVYISSIQYNLPGEGTNTSTYNYKLTIEYYTFHY